MYLYETIDNLLFDQNIFDYYIIIKKIFNYLKKTSVDISKIKSETKEFGLKIVGLFLLLFPKLNIIVKTKLNFHNDIKGSLLDILNDKLKNFNEKMEFINLKIHNIIAINYNSENLIQLVMAVFLKILELLIELYFCIGYDTTNYSKEKIIDFLYLNFF